MHEFKKRIRLLGEKQGFSIEYLPQDSLRLSTGEATIEFKSKSRTEMDCFVTTSAKDSFHFVADKVLVFDIILRFTTPHHQETLRSYKTGQPLIIADYIAEENGENEVMKLQQHISTNPQMAITLGGNRIEVEYYRGVVIITDDLMTVPANVVEV
jgi:hypothetical protein